MRYYQQEEKKIRIYHSHIEISPYRKGESEQLEHSLSVWIDAEYRYEPLGYVIANDTLYIPRGVNPLILKTIFRSTPMVVRDPDRYMTFKDVHMTVAPRNRIQEESIDFLCGEGNFKKSLPFSQQALVLDTGDGKTYTTVNAIVNLQMRAIIITHQEKIKAQWIDTFLTKTDVMPERLMNLDGSEPMIQIMKNEIQPDAYFYFINHQTLNSFARVHGWPYIRDFFQKIQVGIKVFDEAHREFKNVLRTDFFSNTKKTFYLTANFGRSDTKEGKLFRRCFMSVYKFGEQTRNYVEKRKHIIYVPVLYRSNPTFNQLQMANNSYGFSVLGFTNYALHEDREKTQLGELFKIYDLASRLDGKILITVPKINDTEFIAREISLRYWSDFKPGKKTIATINSKNHKYENEEAKKADVIVSTIKSCGTGVDIKKLRCIINLEPFSSNITANQLSGRLREYAPDKDTYFFDLIDIGFPTCENQYKAKLTYLRRKCKEVQVMRE